MMFSSLFQHFGKRERERERLVHFQMTMSPQFMSCHYLLQRRRWQKEVPSTKQETHHEHNWIIKRNIRLLVASMLYSFRTTSEEGPRSNKMEQWNNPIE